MFNNNNPFFNNSNNNPFFGNFNTNSYNNNDMLANWQNLFSMLMNNPFTNHDWQKFSFYDASKPSFAFNDQFIEMNKLFFESHSNPFVDGHQNYVIDFIKMIKNSLNQDIFKNNLNFFKMVETPIYNFLEQLKNNPLNQGTSLNFTNEVVEFTKAFFSLLESRSVLIDITESITTEALELFSTRAKSEEKIESLQKLYFLWSKSYDEVFEKFAKKSRYANTQAKFTNSMLKTQQLFKNIQSQILKLLYIPSYNDLDSVNKKLHDLKREVRELKKQLSNSDSKTLSTNISSNIKKTTSSPTKSKTHSNSKIKSSTTSLAKKNSQSSVKTTKK